MSKTSRQPERLRYNYGQLLSARDLQDDFQAETQLRWWHTVGLHNTWGIALGLQVEPAGGHVKVAPGLAYDSLGRELIVAEHSGIAWPKEGRSERRPSDWILAVRYNTVVDPVPQSEVGLVCLGDRADSEAERPILNWRRAEKVQVGRDVPLVQAILSSSSIGIYYQVRHYARPLLRPHMANGRTPPGAPWQPWTVLDDSGRHLGWLLEVDTSEAGFSVAPYYFASLAANSLRIESDLARRLLGPFTFVTQPRLDSFTFVVLFATSDGAIEFEEFFRDRPPAVEWLGIEPVMRCEPTESLSAP
jgi:hypothetical protein